MKYIKQSFAKRIFALFLCTVLFSSTVFLSYGNTLIVKAVDESDLVYDAVVASLAAIGVYVAGGTLGALALAVGPILAASGKDIYHYVTDNGDGTTTISEDFVQLVLQSYNQYKEENAELFDGTMDADADGYYHFDGVTAVCIHDRINESSYNKSLSFSDINTRYPCALLVYSNQPWRISNRINAVYVVFYIEADDAFYCNNKVYMEGTNDLDPDFVQAVESGFFVSQSDYVLKMLDSGAVSSGNGYLNFNKIQVAGGLPASASMTVSTSSIPAYHDLASLKEGLRTGDFSLAYNYGKIPNCESSWYTGNYPGGDITVQTEKLGSIEEKLDEINETDKSIDDKLKDLLDWLTGNGSGSGGIGAPSGWYEAVLAYLDSILSALEALVWIEADDSISEDQKDLFDLIDKIWEDPENGSQEAADAISGSFSDVARGLTKKFPFSIPWDIHALFTVFANAGNPQPAVVSYSAQPAVMSYSAEPALHYSDSGGIQVYAGDAGVITQEAHNAPYFVLPLVIESWGINEQVVIDLKDFQTLSTLSRTLFSLLFAVFLIKFTISVIKIYKGGGSGD